MVDAAQARRADRPRSNRRHGGERLVADRDGSRCARARCRAWSPGARGTGERSGCRRTPSSAAECARATFFDYPRAGEQGVFEARPGPRWGMLPLTERRGTVPRIGKLRRWRPMDGALFFRVRAHALSRDAVDVARRRAARPSADGGADVATGNDDGGLPRGPLVFPLRCTRHCPVQTVYFAAGRPHRAARLRRRHRRQPGRGAHYWRDYVTVEGMPLASRRIVYARLGWVSRVPMVALDARFDTAGRLRSFHVRQTDDQADDDRRVPRHGEGGKARGARQAPQDDSRRRAQSGGMHQLPRCRHFGFDGKIVAGFAATRQGVLVPFSGWKRLRILAKELADYDQTKGSLHFGPGQAVAGDAGAQAGSRRGSPKAERRPRRRQPGSGREKKQLHWPTPPHSGKAAMVQPGTVAQAPRPARRGWGSRCRR